MSERPETPIIPDHIALLLGAAKKTMGSDWAIIVTGRYTPTGESDHIQVAFSDMEPDHVIVTLAHVAAHSDEQTEFQLQWGGPDARDRPHHGGV